MNKTEKKLRYAKLLHDISVADLGHDWRDNFSEILGNLEKIEGNSKEFHETFLEATKANGCVAIRSALKIAATTVAALNFIDGDQEKREAAEKELTTLLKDAIKISKT